MNENYADHDAVTIADVGYYLMLEKPKKFGEQLRDRIKAVSKK